MSWPQRFSRSGHGSVTHPSKLTRCMFGLSRLLLCCVNTPHHNWGVYLVFNDLWVSLWSLFKPHVVFFVFFVYKPFSRSDRMFCCTVVDGFWVHSFLKTSCTDFCVVVLSRWSWSVLEVTGESITLYHHLTFDVLPGPSPVPSSSDTNWWPHATGTELPGTESFGFIINR